MSNNQKRPGSPITPPPTSKLMRLVGTSSSNEGSDAEVTRIHNENEVFVQKIRTQNDEILDLQRQLSKAQQDFQSLFNSDTKATERALAQVEGELSKLKKDMNDNDRERKHADAIAALRTENRDLRRDLELIRRQRTALSRKLLGESSLFSPYDQPDKIFCEAGTQTYTNDNFWYNKLQESDAGEAAPVTRTFTESNDNEIQKNSSGHLSAVTDAYESICQNTPQEIAIPKWFHTAVKYLLDNELESEFAKLAMSWMVLEQLYQFQTTNHGLSHHKRPNELSEWIKKQKRTAPGPVLATVDSVSDFAESFWSWWNFLQPGWREPGSFNRPDPVRNFGDVWLSLDKPGNNGWVLLLVSLKWWWQSLKALDSSAVKGMKEDWFAAVDDVTSMLNGLVEWRRKRLPYPSIVLK